MFLNLVFDLNTFLIIFSVGFNADFWQVLNEDRGLAVDKSTSIRCNTILARIGHSQTNQNVPTKARLLTCNIYHWLHKPTIWIFSRILK